MPYKLDREQLAWAAGFFDGEGCTTFHRSKTSYYWPRVRIGQSGENGKKILDRFMNAVGIGKVYGPYKIALHQTKIRWYYQATGFEKSQAVIAMLWEWLSEDKRTQAKEVLSHSLH